MGSRRILRFGSFRSFLSATMLRISTFTKVSSSCVGLLRQHGTFFEVTPAGEMVWEYENTFGEKNNSVFRAYQFSQDYSGLVDKNLSK